MDLLISMWRTPRCRVPNDEAWLIKRLNLKSAEVQTLWALVNEFCQFDGNWITQKRLLFEYAQRSNFKNRMSDARNRSKDNKKKSNTGAQSPVLDSPSLNLNTNRISSFCSLEEKATAQKQEQDKSARSLASAPNGALTRSPQTESAEPQQATDKNEMTLAEVRKRMGWQ